MTATKTCSKCGEEKRRAANGRLVCDPCNRARATAYRLKNIETVREKDRARVVAMTPEAKRAKHKKWRDSNIEHVRAKSRQSAKRRYDANPEKFREISRRFHTENREKIIYAFRLERESLSDSYIRTCLGLTESITPQPLIEAKRVQLQIKRLLKERKQ